MSGPGFDLQVPLDYIVRDRANAVENPEFDYDVIVRPVEPRMMRVIWRIVRQREAAEDALQDALAVIWKKRDGGPPPQSPGAHSQDLGLDGHRLPAPEDAPAPSRNARPSGRR